MFVVIWKFSVKENYVNEFIEKYNPNGDWVKIFQNNPNFIETELIRSVDEKYVFLTIDKWKNKDSYYQFLNQKPKEYIELDFICESYTTCEEKIGDFYRDLR